MYVLSNVLQIVGGNATNDLWGLKAWCNFVFCSLFHMYAFRKVFPSRVQLVKIYMSLK